MTTLIQHLGAGKPRAAQLNIPDIVNFEDALRQRGFFGITQSDLEETLISNDAATAYHADVSTDRPQAKAFLTAFSDKEFRVRLCRHIFEGDNAPTCVGIEGLFFGVGEAMR